MSTLDPIVLQETPPLFWLQGFDGVNVHDDRRTIGDQECAWLENFMPLGAGNARTMYDVSDTLYSGPGTIIYQFPFNIGATHYQALFFSDGSAKAVAVNGGAVTVIAGAGKFAVSPSLPACAQWGASGIVIVTAAAYYAWDGALASPGDPAPGWLSGLATPITVTGATNGTITINTTSSTAGLVIGMMITGTDIAPGTTVEGFTANTITLSQAATGTDAGLTFTIQWPMPTGIKGQAVEIFQNRSWVINGAQFSTSAPSNGADFSTADGGLTTKSTDGFLRTKFVNLKQSNGFLYIFGDSSVNVISNVQTSGSPATTTFNNQNVDPNTGLGWRDAIVAFGRALCFANPTGVYAMFGGAATKISDKLDRLFDKGKADFTTVTPTMFSVSIFSVKCIGFIFSTIDPTTSARRTIIALWNGAKWFIGSQSLTSIFGATLQEGADIEGWANDGTNVYQLFFKSSSTLQKKVVSKLWPGRSNLIKKTSKDIYVETADISGNGAVITGTLDSDTNASVAFTITANIIWVNAVSAVITFVNSLNKALQFISTPTGIQGKNANQAGMRLGITLQSTSPDFQLIGTGQSYNEESFYGR